MIYDREINLLLEGIPRKVLKFLEDTPNCLHNRRCWKLSTFFRSTINLPIQRLHSNIQRQRA